MVVCLAVEAFGFEISVDNFGMDVGFVMENDKSMPLQVVV